MQAKQERNSTKDALHTLQNVKSFGKHATCRRQKREMLRKNSTSGRKRQKNSAPIPGMTGKVERVTARHVPCVRVQEDSIRNYLSYGTKHKRISEVTPFMDDFSKDALNGREEESSQQARHVSRKK